MKIINFIFAATFLALAFTKVNDAQSIPWILMFGTMAVICILAMFRVYYKWLIFAVMIPVFYYTTTVHAGAREWIHSGGATNPEEAWNFFQLAFAMVVLVVQGIRSFRTT
jgi:hypothetical protein